MRKLPLMLLLIAPALTGCDDPFEPFPWSDTSVDVRLWSIDRADLIGLPSAFDFVELRRTIVEDPTMSMRWDVALSDVPGGLAFSPAGAYADIEADVGIAVITDRSFNELLEAPRDPAAYVTDSPVPLIEGGVYVVRTRRTICVTTTAPRYAKVQVLELDLEEGSALFKVVRNPNCNDRSFVPPEND